MSGNDWRPISTAPEEQTILVFGREGVEIAVYDCSRETWVETNTGLNIMDASHWMPLPEPPLPASGAGKEDAALSEDEGKG